ncbi:MAG TPA: flagellin [Sphingomonas sp.]|nr:flagellin [Sphingomonas sp.]
MTIAVTGNALNYEIARQQRLASDLAKTQTQISTGKRIYLPSDDVSGATRVSRLVRDTSDTGVWTKNLNLAQSLAAQADTALQSLSDITIRARETMVSAANGTLTDSDRKTQALALRSMAADIRQLRATQSSLGQPLFASVDAIAIPIGAGDTVKPVTTGSAAFGTLDARLEAAAAALEVNDPAAIGAALGDMKSAVEETSIAVADQGLRAARIDKALDRIANRQTDVTAEQSSIEDTDITTAVAKLNAQTITLEAAQAAFARINRRTLFDILG